MELLRKLLLQPYIDVSPLSYISGNNIKYCFMNISLECFKKWQACIRYDKMCSIYHLHRKRVFAMGSYKIRPRQGVAFHSPLRLNLTSQSFRFCSYLADRNLTEPLASATYGGFFTFFLEFDLQSAAAQTNSVIAPPVPKISAIVDGSWSGFKMIIILLTAWRPPASATFFQCLLWFFQ